VKVGVFGGGKREPMPNSYLEWTDENGQIRDLEVVDKIFVGRGCRGIEASKRIIVEDPRVSRDHAIISTTGLGLQITDMSKNGVWVNDVRVAAGSSQGLKDGDIIRIGDALLCVRCPGLALFDEDMERTRSGPIEMIVTSLVADVRGFSALSQRENSSQVYGLMKDIFGTLTTIVRDFKGTIKDYVGDAVYAFWDHGFQPSKGHALLACRAALQQLQALDQMGSSALSGRYPAAEGLPMGWGITTGKVTMAHYSSRAADLALVGDATNLAFRLSSMANKDFATPIAMCSQTADLVQDTLSLVDLGFFTIRGRTGQEHLYGIR
jgi:adenylate cyclase